MPTPKAFTRILTDETLLENARHGSADFPLQYYYEDIWDYDFHCVDWHWHPELEYVYVKTGCAICYIGQEKVAVHAGNGILINSRAVHRFEASASTVIPNIVFSPSLLAHEESLVYRQAIGPVLQSGVSYVLLSADTAWQADCLQKMQEVFSCMERDDPDTLQVVVNLLLVWKEIIRHIQQCSPQQPVGHEHLSHLRLQLMLQYIQEHYQERITLEDIAGSVHIGKSTMMQIFHRYIHLSPIAYLIQYRIRKAAQLLKTTEKSIAAIAEETGFDSSTYFCRQFKAYYQVTPTEYRKKV